MSEKLEPLEENNNLPPLENEDYRLEALDSKNDYSHLRNDEAIVDTFIDEVEKEDILNKNSNHIFFFGTAQSGKSVILSTMLYYLNSNEGVLRPNREAQNDQQSKVLLESFFSNIRQGNLPNRTTKGNVTELNFIFTPNNKSEKVPSTNFTFLEISGEDLSVIRGGGNYGDHIGKYLKADIPLTFIIVTSYDNAHREDTIINQFLDEIELYGKDPKKVNIILVISKWDKSGHLEPRSMDELDDFIDKRLSMTSQRLDTFELDRTYYTVGEISTMGEEKVKRLSLKSAKNLSHWLYESIVGIPLDYEGTFWERIKWSILGK